MTNSKNTKRALYASVISMLLCVTMLIGSTFAWFTDNATTNVNTIQAGKLDIELLDGNSEEAESLEGKTLTFAKAEAAPENEAVLFEPGAKYSLQQVWLHNAGNLHAKYQVVINGIDGSSKLAEVLDVYVDGQKIGKTLAELVSEGGIVKTNIIAPNAYDTFGTIELEMQTSAGNEYQGLTMDGIAITVQATQATVEYDSYNNTYDANAGYENVLVVTNQEELEKVISEVSEDKAVVISLANGEYTLPTSISTGANKSAKTLTFKATKEAVINIGSVTALDCTLTFDNVKIDFGENRGGLMHTKKVVYKDCTINGFQYLFANEVAFANCELYSTSTHEYCLWTYGSRKVSFTDCTFETGGKAILVYNESTSDSFVANISLNNCVFKGDGTITTQKAAVETGANNANSVGSNEYNITFKDCTASGFAANNSTSPLWGNKDSMDKDHLNVVIDGVDVY